MKMPIKVRSLTPNIHYHDTLKKVVFIFVGGVIRSFSQFL